MTILRFMVSKDVFLGLIYIGIGLLYGVYTLIELPLGTAVNMGPGYFPLVLSGMLMLIGGIVLFNGIPTWRERPFGSVNWRAVIAISVSTVIFGMLARGGGMVPATIFTVLAASLASKHASWLGTIGTALFLAFFCTLVFIYGMRLPLGMFGTWFN